MTINFELLNVSKMSNLRIHYITSHGEARRIKFKQQGKRHSKGSIEYPATEGTDVITPYSHEFEKSLYLLSQGLLL